MKKTIFLFSLFLAAALTLSGCSAPSSHRQKKQVRQEQGKERICHKDSDCRPATPLVGVRYKCQQGKCAVIPLGNPASVYCQEKGGRLEIKKGPQGEYGICHFKDGSECEEWKFFRGQCHKGEYFSASSTTSTISFLNKNGSFAGLLTKGKDGGWLITIKGQKFFLSFNSSSGPLRDFFLFLNKNCVKKQCAAIVFGEKEKNLLFIKSISLKNYPNLLTYFQEAREKIKEKYPQYPSANLLKLEAAEKLMCPNCYDFLYSFVKDNKKKTILVKIEDGQVRSIKQTINRRFYSCQAILDNVYSNIYRFPVCAHLVKIVPAPGAGNEIKTQDLWKDFSSPFRACVYKQGGVMVTGYYRGHCSALHLK